MEKKKRKLAPAVQRGGLPLLLKWSIICRWSSLYANRPSNESNLGVALGASLSVCWLGDRHDDADCGR